MWMVEALIKPSKLEAVTRALAEIGVTGLTVTAVKGFGRQNGQVELYGASQYVAELHPKVKLEVVTTDAMFERVIDAIQRAANTSRIGDGKVFISPIEEVLRIRTSERGGNAI